MFRIGDTVRLIVEIGQGEGLYQPEIDNFMENNHGVLRDAGVEKGSMIQSCSTCFKWIFHGYFVLFCETE